MPDAFVAFLAVFVALFPIVNPLGMAPIFLRLTQDAPQGVRANLAWRIAVGSFCLMAISLFVGSHILAFFGLTIAAVQIGGGLVVTVAGWRLLQYGGNSNLGRETGPIKEEDMMGRAFFPLTMPLTVGPGTISVAITLGTRGNHIEHLTVVAAGALIAVFAVSLLIYLSYRFAGNLLHYLGEIGTDVLMRLSAFILLCLGVQIMTNGISALSIFTSR